MNAIATIFGTIITREVYMIKDNSNIREIKEVWVIRVVFFILSFASQASDDLVNTLEAVFYPKWVNGLLL